MSRVEKYREYRSEIAALPDQPKNTKKRQSSQRVDQLLKDNHNNNKLGFEDVYKGLDIYNVSANIEENYYRKGRMNYIIFYTMMSIIVIGLVIALVFVGKAAFGG